MIHSTVIITNFSGQGTIPPSLFDTTRTLMTLDPKIYTTHELTRLTTLSEDLSQVRAGEFIRFGLEPDKSVFLRTSASDYNRNLIRLDGGFGYASMIGPSGSTHKPVHRVVSFTDRTPIDPPLADMQRELDRRKAMATAASRFSPGQRVMYDGRVWIVRFADTSDFGTTVSLGEERGVMLATADPRVLTPAPSHRFTEGQTLAYFSTTPWIAVAEGHLATVTKSCAVGDEYVAIAWDQRVMIQQHVGSYRANHFRLATASDIAAFEARIAPHISNATHAGQRVRASNGREVLILSKNATRALTTWTPDVACIDTTSGDIHCYIPDSLTVIQ